MQQRSPLIIHFISLICKFLSSISLQNNICCSAKMLLFAPIHNGNNGNNGNIFDKKIHLGNGSVLKCKCAIGNSSVHKKL